MKDLKEKWIDNPFRLPVWIMIQMWSKIYICCAQWHQTKTPKCNKTKCIYFSDGASSKYKNCKDFINLCHHNSDHGLPLVMTKAHVMAQGVMSRGLLPMQVYRWLLVKWFPLPMICFNGAKITFLALASFAFLQKILINMLTNLNLINITS